MESGSFGWMGAMASQMPERIGKWTSVWKRFRRWPGSGTSDWTLSERYAIATMLEISQIKAHQNTRIFSMVDEDES